MKKVYFYTGRFTHTFYKELYQHVPEGFAFLPSTPELTGDGIKKDISKTKSKLGKTSYYLEEYLVRLIEQTRLPNLKRISIPKEADLVHSAQAALLNHRPWVVDFENVAVFTWFNRKVLDSRLAKFLLEKVFSSDSCRLLLPWSEAAKKSLVNGLNCERFKDKIEVAYPARFPKERPTPRKKKAGQPTELLMIGTAFYLKGVYETLLAFEKIQKERNVHLTVVSYIPKDIEERFGSNEGITFLSRVSNERIEQAYKEADLFVYPVHTDTFGFVILEAYSYGVPCIANDQYAIPEIVMEGKTGKLVPCSACHFDEQQLPRWGRVSSIIDQPNYPLMPILKNPPADYLNQWVETILSLIENEPLRQEMAENAYQMVATGRFSSQARKERMKELYEKALQH